MSLVQWMEHVVVIGYITFLFMKLKITEISSSDLTGLLSFDNISAFFEKVVNLFFTLLRPFL